MKLLQVVLCVVVGFLGWGAKQATHAQSLHWRERNNRDYTYYHSETFAFKKTLFPAIPFDDERDALSLHNAMEGPGTDEAAISGILAHRSEVQRDKIAETYKRLYSTTLVDDLDGELSGNFGKAILSLTYPYSELMARELRSANKFFSTDTDDIVEVLLSLSNNGIDMVKLHYYVLFHHSIYKDFNNIDRGYRRQLILGLLEAKRDDTTAVRSKLVKSDAQKIISHNWDNVITMFTTRSFKHLKKVFVEYKNKTRHDIDDAFNNLDDVDCKNGLLSIVQRAKSRVGFMAHQLYHTVGVYSVIRIIAGRCEIDLADIVKEYNKKYEPKLADTLKRTFAKYDDFVQILLTLVGKK